MKTSITLRESANQLDAKALHDPAWKAVADALRAIAEYIDENLS